MSENGKAEEAARLAAEEILRTIYGDDLQGCTVKLDTIAGIILQTVGNHEARSRELFDLYEQVVEAVHLLSTPPPQSSQVSDPDKLRALLSERLDAVHTVTTKTRQTVDLVRKRQQG